MTIKKKDFALNFQIGDLLLKQNHMPFGASDKEQIVIRVESIYQRTKNCSIVNNMFNVSALMVNCITEEEKIKIEAEWDSIKISEYNDTENDPCVRLETGVHKQIVPESHIRNLVYQSRHKYNNPAFEVYRCPKCGELHLGKNSTTILSL